MEFLSFFIGMMTIPSAIGAFSYFISCKLWTDYPIVITGLIIYFFLLLQWGEMIFPFLVLASGTSISGAFGLKKIDVRPNASWWDCYLVILSATLLSVMANVGVLVFYPKHSSSVVPNIVVTASMISLLVNTFLSPSLMPYLIWMRKNSEIRSGIDKHFDE